MVKSQFFLFLSGNAIDGGWGRHLSHYLSLGKVQLLTAIPYAPPVMQGAGLRGLACRWGLTRERITA